MEINWYDKTLSLYLSILSKKLQCLINVWMKKRKSYMNHCWRFYWENKRRNHRLNCLYADLHSMWYQCFICCLFWLLLHSKDLKSNSNEIYMCVCIYIYITRLKHLHMIKQTYCHCITARGQMNIKPLTTDSSVFWIRNFMWNVPLLSPWVAKVWSKWSLPRTTVNLRVWLVNGVCMYHDWLLMKRLSHWRHLTKQQSVRVREWERKQTRSHSHW